MDIMERIRTQYSSLSKVQRRIADYVINHADDACFLSLKAFAEKVDATEVTVVNFTHRIGLKSFVEFKKALQDLLRSRVSPNDKLVHALSMAQGMNSYVTACMENEQQILQQTFSGLDVRQLQGALALIEHASKIFIIGYDIALPVVDFMVTRMRYLGLAIEPLRFSDLSHMTLEISQGGQDTLFILVSFPVHAAEMLALSAMLRQAGLPVLAVVNDAACAVAQNATQVLCCDTTDVVFYNSITAAIALMNLLCTLYASRHQDDLINTRSRIQHTVDDLTEQVKLVAQDGGWPWGKRA